MEDEYRQAFEDAAFCDLDADWCSEDDSDVPSALEPLSLIGSD